jgi:Erv1 / Alr family
MPRRSRQQTRKQTRKLPATPDFYFRDQDYDSNDGMLTSIWGPATWHLLHCLSFNYPVHPTKLQKQQYLDFVKSLRHVLPCGKCRQNLSDNLAKLPITMKAMENRDTFSRYIYTLHETVNHMLKKSSGLSYETVRERYEHFRARCHRQKHNQTLKKSKKGDLGCVVPFHGKKTKCLLRIVDAEKKCPTFATGK